MDLEISIFKIKLGERFVSAFETEKIIKNKWKNGKINIDIFNNNNSSSYDREAISLEFNENIIQENIDKITNILPTSLPMICQPNKWSDSEYGGYLNNSIEKNKLITGLGINNDHTIQNLDKLYNSINYLNSIKFRVNTEVLDFIKINKKKVFENYYQCENKLNDNINDNVLRDAVTLEIAKTFTNIPFYLNTYADWRGRIYTASYYLSYQGSSLSLSLLQFDEGQIISKSGEYFFKVYGANLHDENKISRASYKDRIKWVDDNESKILNMDMEFILRADSRFDFIAFCFAYKRFKNNKKVHLPIFLDATCSGIQHLSTILKDVELAKSVNVIPDETDTTDKVHDIYSEMIEPTNKRIASFVDENPSFFNLLNVNITRKLIKPTIMTVPYNVTVKGVTRQLISSFEVVPRNQLESQNLYSDLEMFEVKDLSKSLINDEPVIENFDDEINEDLKDYYGLEKNNENNEKFKDKSSTKFVEKIMFKVPSVNENENLYLTYKEVFHLAKIMHETLFNYYPALKNYSNILYQFV